MNTNTLNLSLPFSHSVPFSSDLQRLAAHLQKTFAFLLALEVVLPEVFNSLLDAQPPC